MIGLTCFRFNLEPVLNYRCRLEEIAKEELAHNLNLCQQERATLEDVEKELSAAMVPVNRGPLKLGELLLKERYLGFLEEQLEIQTAKVIKAEDVVLQCRGQLEQKMRERKAMETLKEKRWQEFRYQQDQEEQKRIDDLATAQYIRQVQER